MNKPRVALFGTPDYSLLVFEGLRKAGYPISIVVTKPPLPVGRKQIPTPTAVAVWAAKKQIPVVYPKSNSAKPWLLADEASLTQEVLKYNPDILITADYTQKIPLGLIKQIKFNGLNVHPSFLPAYRGPAPVPWAILNGESVTGVSIVTLAEKFDEGRIIAQEKESILPTDSTDLLLTRLFIKGGMLLLEILPKYIVNTNLQLTTYNLQPSYFPRLTRDDGYIPWELVKAAIEGKSVSLSTMKQWSNVAMMRSILNRIKSNSPQSLAVLIDRAFRALHPWPGVWTKVILNGQEKRLKLLKLHLQPTTYNLQLGSIQLEGKQPVSGQAVTNLLNLLS